MDISFYDPNGFISSVLSSDEQTIKLNKSLANNWVDGKWDSATHYVTNGKAELRPENPTTLDGMVLRNVPAPCKIVINSKEYEVTDKKVELEFDYPGVYKITVLAFPFLDAEFQIEVEA